MTMKAINRILSLALAVLLISGMSFPVFAAAPEITTDETAYVTLDYYGTPNYISVVKAVNTNGNMNITDYGRYSSIKNMSTQDQPEISNTGVNWNLSQEMPGRFYNEVVPEDQDMDIPWHFDISYKLNGVPIHAEKLAGASGVVTIDVTATPNPAADPYYRNNFILMAGMIADAEDNYSFYAPGAQFQSIGSIQAAFFIALPKQEADFHFEIGSNSFETSGIIMLMVPATISRAEDISRIREHKENIEDAGNAVDALLDDMLSIVQSTSSGMSRAADGLDTLNQAREIIYNDRDSISASVARVRGSLKRMEASLSDYSDVMNGSGLPASIREMSRGLDKALDSMDDMGDEISAICASIQRLTDLLSMLADSPVADSPIATAGITQAEFYDDERDRDITVDSLTGEQNDIIEEIQAETENLQNLLNEAESNNYAANIENDVQALLYTVSNYQSSEIALGTSTDVSSGTDQQIINQMIAALVNELNNINRSLSSAIGYGEDMIDDMGDMVSGMKDTSREIEKILSETGVALEDASNLLNSFDTMVGAIDNMLSQSEELLNDGLNTTLDGMASLMREMVVALQKTDDIKKNKDIIADIIRDEWNNLDDDFGIFDMDINAKKQSFTSARNEEPRSLQIIVRTQEIEIEDEKVNIVPVVEENIGFMGRLKLVFAKIWSWFSLN